MRRQSLLLIDDDQEDSELFRMALRSVDVSVELRNVLSAVKALSMLDTKELAPDAIVVDLNMPIMTGEQFLEEKQKRAHLQAIPVFVLSTSSEKEILAKARSLGAVEAFTKPNSLPELKTLIKSIIE